MNEQKLAELVKVGIQKIWTEVKDVKSIWQAAKCAPAVVSQVEEIGKTEGLKGSDKKALAVEMILSFVKLPMWLPRPFAVYILGMVVEKALAAVKAIKAKVSEKSSS